MDFSLSEEQEILRNTTRSFLTKECPPSFVKETIKDERGYSPEIWRKMAEMGWMGFIFPESYGGMGGSFIDMAVLLEEMGRAALPSPFFSTVIMSGLAVLEGGNDKQKDELLPAIVNGNSIFTLAITERGGEYTPDGIGVTAARSGNGYVISGTKLFVSDAGIADHIIADPAPLTRTSF